MTTWTSKKEQYMNEQVGRISFWNNPAFNVLHAGVHTKMWNMTTRLVIQARQPCPDMLQPAPRVQFIPHRIYTIKITTMMKLLETSKNWLDRGWHYAHIWWWHHVLWNGCCLYQETSDIKIQITGRFGNLRPQLKTLLSAEENICSSTRNSRCWPKQNG